MGKTETTGLGRVLATRVMEFDAGHRLLKHESKCRNVHGHRYRLELSVAAPARDELGRVIDFSVIKREIGGWLDEHWDHAYICHTRDPLLPLLSAEGLRVWCLGEVEPTAENMVELIVSVAMRRLAPYGMQVVHARLYETPNCYVDWKGEPWATQ